MKLDRCDLACSLHFEFHVEFDLIVVFGIAIEFFMFFKEVPKYLKWKFVGYNPVQEPHETLYLFLQLAFRSDLV